MEDLEAQRPEGRISRLVGKPLFWIVVIAILFSWPIARSLVAQSRMPPPAPVLGRVAPFTLVNQDGVDIDLERLLGKTWIVHFYHSDDRGAMSETFELQHRTRGLGKAIHLVSVSLEPIPVPALHELAKKQRFSRRVWTFLTGDAATLRAGLTAFELDAGPINAAWPTHDFLLIDRFGKIRGIYSLDEPRALRRLLRDAGLLINRGN